jgi:DNA/RNA endonuclease YhcR with UshA esterase domain
MNKKKIISTILILGILGAFIAYKMYNKPHVDVAETAADISIAANTILTEFSTDETTANAKYLDKIVAVKGAISAIKTEKGKGIITLKTNDDFGNILCHLSEVSTQKISDLKEGQTITVKGICTGFLMDVVLVKSEIIN